MLARDTPSDLQDAVWTELVTLAQGGDERWQLEAVWMMLPGLRKIVSRLTRGTGSRFGEMEAEVVAGFLEELRDVDAGRAKVGAFLWWSTFRRAWRARSRDEREIPSEELALIAAERELQDHDIRPLVEAVHEGVPSVSEADLINRTRIEGERLGAIAERMGLRYHACRQRRARAEGRLAGYLLVRNDAAPADPGHPLPLRRRVRGDAA
ncbi:hypothetical protein [Actinomadura sp. 9N215]|uniref:hypothetical protein n=1 Tax=Actinomadura sp. 9N215 TaxID=3375150 RepID=UPI0037AE4D83